MVLPFCIILWIIAPNLLHAWVGGFTPKASLIMRLTCVAVLAQGLGLGAMQVLWGRGEVRAILLVLGILAVPSLVLTVGFVRAFGEVGAAFALCISLSVSTCIFLFQGARACRLPVINLLRDTFRGLPLPCAVCAAFTYVAVKFANPQSWAGVVGSCLLGGSTFIAVLYFFGAREEEKQFVCQAMGLRPPLRIARFEFAESALPAHEDKAGR
jgi:O-antigen/teichoic acid export membrane protein